MTARAPATAWLLSDGKAGDRVQLEGVAAALGVAAEPRIVRPRAPWSWLMPHGPIDPGEAESKQNSPIRPPFPDIVLATGRRTVPYVRRLKAISGDRPFTVFLKDPHTGRDTADLIWVPAHDRLRGNNVVVTVTSPHKVSKAVLEKAAEGPPPPPFDALAAPRIAVLVGGDSRHFRFTAKDIALFSGYLRQVIDQGAAPMVTFSRRTENSDPCLKTAIAEALGGRGAVWSGTGENPYPAMLAHADAIVVTADSVNMVGEAVATGRPVLVFEPSPRGFGRNRKIHSFLKALEDKDAIAPFTGRLETFTYDPIDSTPVIARAILAHYEHFRSAGT